MHTSNTLWSGLGSREGHKPRFPPIGTGLYEISHSNFGESPF